MKFQAKKQKNFKERMNIKKRKRFLIKSKDANPGNITNRVSTRTSSS